ncbi:hypothetical protein [Rhodococcus sp. SGAir0479]|uniref:hypothetical protein n=1 Tax=Rhodococcus sp. SGAir0479 TaxID=2567884 RepID=UPI0010CD2A33|nr:hypothetical protein [Rhodococcus sp. SGAir0479]QCQ93022.1 hypothetical protein E7742_18545 [Rhodococcus sp. SGAir0479]
MEQVWVEPARLIDAAVTVRAAAGRLADAKPSVAEVDSELPASLVATACGEGSRSAVRVLDIVGERLRAWSATAEETLAEVTGTDAATARALDGVGVDR